MTSPVAVRFSVGSSDGSRSMAWRLWTGHRRPSDEVYVAPRHMAGDLKFSAHRSGYAQIGPTQRMRSRLSPDDRHALSRVELGPVEGQVVLRLLFHRTQLRHREAAADEQTIAMRDEEDALLVLVMVGPVPGDLPQDFRTVSSVARRSREPVYLVAGPVAPVPQLITEALDLLSQPYESWLMPVDWTYEQHAVIEAAEEHAGPPLLIEFAVDDPPPQRVPVSFEGFPGQLLAFDELPIPVPEAVDVCAAVWIDEGGQVRLYLNERARCDHGHLRSDVDHLMKAFMESGPDEGWTALDPHRVEGGGWITAVVSRGARGQTRPPRN